MVYVVTDQYDLFSTCYSHCFEVATSHSLLTDQHRLLLVVYGHCFEVATSHSLLTDQHLYT